MTVGMRIAAGSAWSPPVRYQPLNAPKANRNSCSVRGERTLQRAKCSHPVEGHHRPKIGHDIAAFAKTGMRRQTPGEHGHHLYAHIPRVFQIEPDRIGEKISDFRLYGFVPLSKIHLVESQEFIDRFGLLLGAVGASGLLRRPDAPEQLGLPARKQVGKSENRYS